jgi:Secretion system C-terminal sorting domain
MKKVIIILAIFFCKIEIMKSQTIETIVVSQNLDTVNVKYKLAFWVSSNKESRVSYRYSLNADTLNVFSFLKLALFGNDQILAYNSSLNIPVANSQKLCYLNFYTVTDTNSIYNPWDTFYAFYPLDTMSYDFKHCWPLAINIKRNLETQLYPNPCAHFLNISNLGNGISNINIVNVQGQIVPASWHWNGSNININTSNLLPGLYFLKLESEDGIKYQKFRKE